MSVDTAPAPAPASGADATMGSPEITSSASGPHGGNGGSTANQFTLRALVSSKEAGVIIGKAGKNVADLREATGVKAGVSKVVPGVPERVLTVSGSLEQVSKAYSSILSSVAENPSAQNEGISAGISPSISVKLLVANALMGSVIGKAGATIQNLQAKNNVKIITVKEMLPNSTERIVSVEGPLSAVDSTIQELVQIISEQAESGRLNNHILYQPGSHSANAAAAATGAAGGFQTPYGGQMGGFRNNGFAGQRRTSGNNNGVNRTAGGAAASQAVPTPSNPELRTQNISIPSDMVGCIIGRGGTKINEIRKESGAKISIAKDAHDESGERMFTITGTSESLEQALYMLYGQLEGEKEKRIASQKQEEGGDMQVEQ